MRPRRYPYQRLKRMVNVSADMQQKASQTYLEAIREAQQQSVLELLRVLESLSEKIDRIELLLDPESKIIDSILKTLSSDRGIIVDPDVGTARGARGVSGSDMMAILGK